MGRLVLHWVCVCALGVMPLVGCSETAGAGGGGGSGATAGAGGAGGGGGAIAPGMLLDWELRAALGMKLWTVRYTSEAIDGTPIEVTGMVATPVEPPAEGLRDVVSFAHGTTGVSDPCAPSTQVQPEFFSVATSAIDAGYVVTATDYEGLGTPGLHPYYVRESEGRGVVDIVRAARQLEEAHSGSRVVVWGNSQGGHAALSAGEVAPEWASDVEVLGVVSGAPGSELPSVFEGGSGRARGFLWEMTLGFAEAYPGLSLEDVYEAEALDVIRGLVEDEACNPEFLDTAEPFENAGFATNPVDIPEWLEVLEANSPGNVRSEMPILLIHGTEDMVVPPSLSDALFERLCETGSQTDYRVIEGAGHGAFRENLPMVLEWTAERFAEEAATDTCPN